MTWEQINAEWLTGAKVARTEAETVAAFDTVEQTFGREWMEATRTRNGTTFAGSAPTLHVVVLGERLAALRGVANAEPLVRKIREHQPGATAELETIYLLRGRNANTDVELEPEVQSGRRPDFRIRSRAGPWTYVEVTQAQNSAAYASIVEIAQRLAKPDFPGKGELRYAIELFLAREPTPAEVDVVVRRIPEFARVPSGSIDLDSGLGQVFVNDATPGQVVLRDRGIGGSEPRLGVANVEVEDGHAVRHVAVRVPFTDQRAEQFVTAEARQLPKSDPGLIVISLAGAPGGFNKWEPLIRRRFQPTMHTRVGGVVLVQGGQVTSANGEDVQVQVKPIWNPHARLSVPAWVTDRVNELARQ